jgi:two-component system chemotaxis response regulator CheB
MTMQTPVRVMVVDDSAFMRTALTRMIQSDPGLEVVGCATDGQQALEILPKLDPDVITMDIEMPRMNGLEALRKVMAETPRPVIMISSLSQEGAQATFDALEAGAFDYIPKQLSYVSLDIVKIRDELTAKVRAAAASSIRSRTKAGTRTKPMTAELRVAVPQTGTTPLIPSVVCIGTSTGGPKALQQILPMLPQTLTAGVLVVQHMPPGFTRPFAERLNGICRVRIREAEEEDWIEPGTVLIAPAGWHMTPFRKTHSRYAVHLAKTPAGKLHMPSVDVMMIAAAEVFRAMAMGVILTGMGNDGEEGMRAIYAAGGWTVGQDEASCTVYGMPRACALAGVLRRVVPLTQVPGEIVSATRTPQA